MISNNKFVLVITIIIVTIILLVQVGCSQKETNPLCPICNLNKDVIPIIYGLPDNELFKEGENGKVKLGGCIITDNDPQWYCKKCEKDF